MTKCLQNIGLPDGFDAPEGYLSEIDDETKKIYEQWVIETQLDFDEATTRLVAFLGIHFAVEPQIASKQIAGFRTWFAGWKCPNQEVTASLNDDDEEDIRYGWIHSVRDA